jgi:signal transduction histidine kinase
MTSIQGFINLLMNEDAGPLTQQQKQFLTMTMKAVDRLNVFTSHLIEIFNLESGQLRLKRVSVNVSALLHEMALDYQAQIQAKPLNLILNVEDSLPRVFADQDRLKQVIRTLISNAIKFTPANGQIRLEAEDKGDFVMITVSDTGAGIKKEDRARIFEKFFQADPYAPHQIYGTGLELAIAKVIVETQGGRIWVESELGHGASFHILLPRFKESF